MLSLFLKFRRAVDHRAVVAEIVMNVVMERHATALLSNRYFSSSTNS